MTTIDKSALRSESVAIRDAVENRHQKDANIRARLHGDARFQSANDLLLYVSMRSEVGTHTIISEALEQGRRIYIPYCDGDRLGIFPLQNWEQLETKAFGILEPKDDLLKELPDPKEFPIDVILVPGLAFDTQFNRLGYGKGHYDRLLANTYPKAFRMALAYADQVVESLPTHEFDIPMHAIVTDRGIMSAAVEPNEDFS